jgi:outer membrane murein-binding lipoprotein Lpp
MAKSDEGAPSAHDAPLLIEGPKALTEGVGPIIDLEPLSGLSNEEKIDPQFSAEAPAAEESIETPDAAAYSRWTLPSYAPLAAGIALAVGIGAVAGATATVSLLHDSGPSPVSLAASHDSRALRDSVAQLNSELAALKAGIAGAQKTAATQFTRLNERLDRTEKAQAEPAAKLAKIQESLDRLDHRPQQVAATPTLAPGPSADVTGSIAAKEESRPPIAEGWHMRDFRAGRALVQSRNGTLFEVGLGSNLPGLGRVEQIKREKDQVVVIAQNGTIAGPISSPRRLPYFAPYRY